MKHIIYAMISIILLSSIITIKLNKLKQNTITFAVISDIHFDPYFIDETANEKKLYCRNNIEYVDELIEKINQDQTGTESFGLSAENLKKLNKLKENKKLNRIKVFDALMKESVEEIKNTGVLGNYRCDTNINLFIKILDLLKKENFTDLIILGDFVAHRLNKEQGLKAISYVNELISNSFKNKKINVHIAIGNHDFSTSYNFPETEENFNNEIQQIKKMENGTNIKPYYEKIIGNVKFIFLYSQAFNIEFKEVDYLPEFIDNQKRFLEHQLENSRKINQKVIICLHLSPFTDYDDSKYPKPNWLYEHAKWFDQLMDIYKSTVLMIFGAHDHKTEFSLRINKEDIPYMPTILFPAVSTKKLNNPGYSIVNLINESKIEVTFKSYMLKRENKKKKRIKSKSFSIENIDALKKLMLDKTKTKDEAANYINLKYGFSKFSKDLKDDIYFLAGSICSNFMIYFDPLNHVEDIDNCLRLNLFDKWKDFDVKDFILNLKKTIEKKELKDKTKVTLDDINNFENGFKEVLSKIDNKTKNT